MKKESKSTKDTGHSFADYFKRALNPLLVLLLLSEQPMYVYEMMREISKRSDGRYTISLLYPVIQRLLSQGYVCEGQKAISDDNRVRQYYEITSDGISYLRQRPFMLKCLKRYSKFIKTPEVATHDGG